MWRHQTHRWPVTWSIIHRHCDCTHNSSSHSLMSALFSHSHTNSSVISDPATPSCPAVTAFPSFPSPDLHRLLAHLFPLSLTSPSVFTGPFPQSCPDRLLCFCLVFQPHVLPAWLCLAIGPLPLSLTPFWIILSVLIGLPGFDFCLLFDHKLSLNTCLWVYMFLISETLAGEIMKHLNWCCTWRTKSNTTACDCPYCSFVDETFIFMALKRRN